MLFRTSTAVFVSFLMLAGFASPVYAQTPANILIPGKTSRGFINTQRGEDSRRFQIIVPAEAWEAHIQLDAGDADIELLLLDSDNNLVTHASTPQRRESITINRLSSPMHLETGTYTVEVAFSSALPGTTSHNGSFGLQYDILSTGTAQALAPGQVIKGSLEPAKGMISVYEINLPVPMPTLRFDCYDTDADIELFASFTPGPNLALAEYKASVPHGYESIIVDGKDIAKAQAANKACKLYLSVTAPWDNDKLAFSIAASATRDALPEIRKLPVFPVTGNALQRAVLATVEISTPYGTGSGCIIHPSGIILTNFHVIADSSDEPATLVDVGITLDQTRPASMSFKAKLLENDRERDLCLLKIDRGFYDQDIPAAYKFPHLELAKSGNMFLGDDLIALGYPGIGGLGSRASINLSRGVVSGFQNTRFGLILKTDAEINSGSSGGAAIDRTFKLVGMPTTVFSEGGGQIAFIHTIDFLPTEWLKIVAGQH